jgi:diguanylate cyclase (GGDEF)-like protein
VLAVMFLDLDDFKAVNDELGHEIGDQLLCAVANDLSSAVRETDTVCRIGGDEFVLVLPDIGRDDLGLIATKIGALIATARQFGSHAVHSSASIGCSIYPDDGEYAETLVKQADLAMYRAKRLRRAPAARGVG